MKTYFFGKSLVASFFRWQIPLLAALFLVLSNVASPASVIFSENMGTTATGNSPYPSVSTFTGFQNYGALSYSGSGDVRTTSASSGYAGASGSDNVYLTSSGTANFIIGSINTVGYSSLSLSFGADKSAIASDMSELTLEYSIDGGLTYSPLVIPTQPTGSGTAVWRLISDISLPSDADGVSDLLLEWVNTATSSVQFRLDDITLTGVATSVVPEPAAYGLISGIGLLCICGVGIWREQRASKRA